MTRAPVACGASKVRCDDVHHYIPDPYSIRDVYTKWNSPHHLINHIPYMNDMENETQLAKLPINLVPNTPYTKYTKNETQLTCIYIRIPTQTYEKRNETQFGDHNNTRGAMP
jgi:hypothetical protein